MIKEDVLEHVCRHTCLHESPHQPFTGQQGLRGMLQDDGIARYQRRCHRVDGSQIRIVPWCDHQHQPVRFMLDAAFEPVAVFYDNRFEGVCCNVGHIGRAFINTAEFPTITHRSAHHVGNFRHHFVIHLAQPGKSLAHQRNALVQRPCSP